MHNWRADLREKMLLLFETAAGFALFKVLQENKIQETEVSPCKENCQRRLAVTIAGSP